MSNSLTVQPLVSVIVPVYNAQEFVRKGYLQLSMQYYENLEFIFIDNNSSDLTYDLLCEIQKTDGRVKVFKECKQGAGAARNKGLQIASGEFVTFFDIDDTWTRDRIKRHITIFNRFPEVEMVFSNLLKKYEENPLKSYVIPKWGFNVGIFSPPQVGVIWMEKFFALPGIHACTIRSSSIEKVGGFPDFLQRGEDAAFLVKCGLNLVLFFDSHILGEYVKHSQSTTSKQNKEKSLSQIYYYQRKNFYLKYIASLDNDALQKSFDKIMMHSLIDFCFDREKKSVVRRINLMRKEIGDLKEKGWHLLLRERINLILFCFFSRSFAFLLFRFARRIKVIRSI